jgi:DNA-binding MarR family transcriptional regulator
MTDPTIRELLSYRLHQVANLLSRGAELRYRREFGVSLWEWRTVALLGGAREPQSLNDLARAAGMDKGQMSRVVSGLTRKEIVAREADANDARGIRLSLTRAGMKLYRKLIGAAAERNSAFLGCLSAQERACLEKAMTKLASEARGLILREKENQGQSTISRAARLGRP